MKTKMLLLNLLFICQVVVSQSITVWEKEFEHSIFKTNGDKMFVLVDGKLMAQSTKTFDLLWEVPSNITTDSYKDIYFDSEHVYVTGYNNGENAYYLYAFDQNTGKQLWKYKDSNTTRFFGTSHGKVFIAGKGILGIDATTGKIAFSEKGSSAYPADDFLYISNHEYVKNGTDKDWLTTYNYDGKLTQENYLIGDTVFNAVQFSNNKTKVLLSMVSGWDKPYIVEKETNKILWEGHLKWSYKPIGDKVIEYGFTKVTAKELKTGKELWSYEAGGNINNVFENADNSLVFCSMNGEIVKLDYNSGAVIWKNVPEMGILNFDVVAQTLIVSYGTKDREWEFFGKRMVAIDISKMTHENFMAQEKIRMDKELQAQRTEANKKRMEYQKANTYLTIRSGGHKANIRKIAVTNDSKNILSAGDDKVINIWNIQSGELIESLYGQIGEDAEGKIYAMALSPDNKYLAVAGFFSSRYDYSGKCSAIRLYDFPNRKLIGLMQNADRNPTNSLAFSEDSKLLVAGGTTVITIWNVLDQSIVRTINQEYGSVFYDLVVKNNKIITGSLNSCVELWDLNNGTTAIKTDTTHSNSVSCIGISADGGTIASGGFDNQLVIYDGNLTVRQVIDNKTSPSSIAFSPDGKKIFLGCEGDTLKANLYEFDGANWVKTSSYDQFNTILATTFIDNYTTVCAGGENREIAVLKWDKNQKTNSINPKEILRVSGNGKSVYGVGSVNNEIYISNKEAADFTKTELTKKFDLFSKNISTVTLEPKGISRAVLNQGDLSLVTGDEHLKTFSGRDYIEKRLSVMSNGTEITKILKSDFDGNEHLAYTFLKNNEIVSGGFRGVLLVYNTEGKMISRLIGHSSPITDLAPTADGNFLISCSDDQTIKFWRISDFGKEATEFPAPADVLEPDYFPKLFEKLSVVDASKEKSKEGWKEIIAVLEKYGIEEERAFLQKALDFFSAGPVFPTASIFVGNDNEWVIWSNDGYFTSSKYGGKYIGYHINQGYDREAKFYPFEQFDLKFNRPDIMLARVGINDEMLSQAYYLAYKKRLTKMGLTEEELSDDIHLPEITLQSRSQETASKNTVVEFDAKDDTYLIDRLNILVNDVPVFGSKGFSVRNLNQQSVHEKFNIELTKGKNKIQVSAMNEKGAESMKETYYVTCNDAAPQVKNRYVVAIGVSNYANNEYDLKYAAKDAGDVAKLLEMNKGEFASTKVLRILDTVATRENILKAKRFLMQSKVGDQVILFVSGHGLLDNNMEWYFATADVDFNNPAQRGLAYSDLEGLLDSIPARNKLMLMDACHSGEVDKEDAVLVANTSQQVTGVKSRGFKSVASKSQSLGLQNSFQLMQNLFSDISNGTGTTVISSASGAEFAYESAAWNNGVFTFALLEGLKTGNADKNKDGKIVVSELRDYIAEKVKTLTQGKQNPTSRKENLEFDFRIQ